jgi:hypothetical protein
MSKFFGITDEKQKMKISKIAAGIIGTVLLGAIGSGIWDIVFRPGYDRLGHFVTDISQSAEDAAYLSAALDPTPIPNLIILFLIAQIPLWIALIVFLETFAKTTILSKLDRWSKKKGSEKEAKRKLAFRRSLAGGLIVFSLLFFMATRIGFSIANQATWIWRVHNTNMAICAPFFSQDERLILEAQFRQVQKASAYNEIQQKLTGVANKNGLKLHVISPTN